MTNQRKRELDAWIAERVMGFERATRDGVPIWKVPGSDEFYFIPEGEHFDSLVDWCPTVCADNAFRVLKKCLDKTDVHSYPPPEPDADQPRYRIWGGGVAEKPKRSNSQSACLPGNCSNDHPRTRPLHLRPVRRRVSARRGPLGTARVWSMTYQEHGK